MTPEAVLDEYKRNGCGMTPLCQKAVADPHTRIGIYRLIPNKPTNDFHALLRAMFHEEMRFRDALWSREVKDEDDLFENIYLCAFLLHQIGDVRDVMLMWQAKHLNMDVCCRLDAHYMVGAGLQATRGHLKQLGTPEAQEALEYIDGWELTPTDISDWVTGQIEYFGRTTG